MTDMEPSETEKLEIGKMGAESNGQQPEKAEEKGENEAGEDDKAQDGESRKNNSEKEQEREVGRIQNQEEGHGTHQRVILGRRKQNMSFLRHK